MIGETINTRYEIKAELGQGGMGTVYLAHDQTLNRDVAIKLMSDTKLGTEGRARLLHEAQTIAQLNHPNIVTVFDAGEFQGSPYIVMELVEGGTLENNKPAGMDGIVTIAREICHALQHAHDHQIIHRDLKPENISIGTDGKLRLMDFGLARSVASRLTSDGGIVGTVFYMAPEQAMGQELDARADLYALGVILYELATGALPFEDQDPIAVISQHIYAPPISARAKNPDVPPLLNDLIMRLLSKERDERPRSAENVLNVLNDPALLDTTAGTVEELSLLDRIVRGRIIGRKDEFEEARTLWAKAQSGQGQLLLISGEPGVGKTRLMREIATHAEVSGGRALIGESFAEGNPPYGAFGQIVRKALQPASTNGFHLADFILSDLLTVAPELRQHYPDVSPNPKLEPEAERQRLFENVTAFSETLSEHAPLLIVIDDAHWSDSGTLFLLHHLARRIKNMPIMIVATYREIELIGTHPLNDMLLELNRQRLGTRVKLSRLDIDKTRQLLGAIFAEEVSLEFAELIYRETEGNPFFIEEVCKALVESGVLYYEDGEWHRPELHEIEIPQSVQVAVEARLLKLDESILEVLRMAAILGREFEFDTMLKSSDRTEDELVQALEAAEEAQLLNEVSSKAGGVFSFAHALIPAALISGLSGLRRRRLHRQALAAHEELHPEDYASLAHHAAEAGDINKTMEYAEKAGSAAAALYAWEEANMQYHRAIEAAEELGENETLAKIHDLAGNARSGQGRNNQAIEHWLLANKLTADQTLKLLTKGKVGNVYIFIGDERGLPLLEELRQELDPKTMPEEMAWTIIGIGRHHHLHGQHQKALDSYRDAQKIVDELDNGYLQSSIYTFGAGAYQHLTKYEESNKLAQASIDLGQRENLPSAEAVGLEFLGENAAGRGLWQSALEIGERELRVAKQVGDQNRIGWTYFYSAWAYHGLGMLSKAADVCQSGLEIAELTGDMRCRALLLGLNTYVLTDLGRIEEARQMGFLAIERGAQIGQIAMIGNTNDAMAYFHIQVEEWQPALELLEDVAEAHKDSDARWVLNISNTLRVESLWGLGNLDEAIKLAKENLKSVQEAGVIYLQSDTYRILAQIAFSQGKFDSALEKIGNAVKMAEKENYRIGLGRALYWKAKILASHSDTKTARGSAAQAVEIFETCGALLDLEKVQSLLSGLK